MAHNMRDADNNNCLHLAAASNDWRTLRALLEMFAAAFADCVIHLMTGKRRIETHVQHYSLQLLRFRWRS